MPALQQFFEAERLKRGWSMRQATRQCKISLSKGYAIEKGDDNVELETFENIAAAFDMSVAELAVVIGKGPASVDPDEVEAAMLIRRMPSNVRPAAKNMLRGLAVDDSPRTKTPAVGPTKTLERRRREILTGTDADTLRDPKRRQFSIRKVQTWGEHAVVGVLSALGLNRDFRPVEAAA